MWFGTGEKQAPYGQMASDGWVERWKDRWIESIGRLAKGKTL